MKTDENTSVAYALNEDGDFWIISCPFCGCEVKSFGFFDIDEPYRCLDCRKDYYASSLEGDEWRIE